MRINILSLNAKGDGKTLNTKIIQRACDECAKRGGGTIIIPEGRFLTGHFVIGSYTTLYIEKGGVLLSSPKLEDHIYEEKPAGLIFAKNAKKIVIKGKGIIDGQPEPFFDFTQDHDAGDPIPVKNFTRSQDGPVKPLKRPGNLIVLSCCSNFLIEDIKIRGSSYWTIHIADSTDGKIRNVTIEHDQRIPNNDGIHITNSKKIIIRGCKITTGDDCIAISGWTKPKSEPEIHLGFSAKDNPSKDIKVSRCILSSRSAAIRVWTNETDVCNVKFSNIIINNSNRGIGVFSRGKGKISNISFKNFRITTRYHQGRWWGKAEPIHISSIPVEEDVMSGEIENISFKNIKATSENGIVIYSFLKGLIKKVLLSNIRLTLKPGNNTIANTGLLDLRPVRTDLKGEVPKEIRPLIAEKIDTLEIKDFSVNIKTDSNEKYKLNPSFEEVQNIVIKKYSENKE